jgi:N-acetylmuramoyl-L-alanine amidase
MKKKISIEIGHGGIDPGAVSGSFREKDINLTVSLELKRQLERHGIKVQINRTSDVNHNAESFFQRVLEFKPDAGISVHTNAGGGNGFEVFRQTSSSQKANSIRLCQAIASEVSAAGQILRNPAVRSYTTHPTPNGQRFTQRMNTVSAPWAFCELGFIDNPTDRARWDTAAKQRAFGTAYAKGILNYFGITWVEEARAAAPALHPVRLIAGNYKHPHEAEPQRQFLLRNGFPNAFIQNINQQAQT